MKTWGVRNIHLLGLLGRALRSPRSVPHVVLASHLAVYCHSFHLKERSESGAGKLHPKAESGENVRWSRSGRKMERKAFEHGFEAA